MYQSDSMSSLIIILTYLSYFTSSLSLIFLFESGRVEIDVRGLYRCFFW